MHVCVCVVVLVTRGQRATRAYGEIVTLVCVCGCAGNTRPIGLLATRAYGELVTRVCGSAGNTRLTGT